MTASRTILPHVKYFVPIFSIQHSCVGISLWAPQLPSLVHTNLYRCFCIQNGNRENALQPPIHLPLPSHLRHIRQQLVSCLLPPLLLDHFVPVECSLNAKQTRYRMVNTNGPHEVQQSEDVATSNWTYLVFPFPENFLFALRKSNP
jgi:hypothetical protein